MATRKSTSSAGCRECPPEGSIGGAPVSTAQPFTGPGAPAPANHPTTKPGVWLQGRALKQNKLERCGLLIFLPRLWNNGYCLTRCSGYTSALHTQVGRSEKEISPRRVIKVGAQNHVWDKKLFLCRTNKHHFCPSRNQQQRKVRYVADLLNPWKMDSTESLWGLT